MITDIHVHHVPEAFVRWIEAAQPFAMRLGTPRGESVSLTVGTLNYTLNRTFFDVERLVSRMNEISVDRAVLSLATPFVKYDVPADLGCAAAELYNNEIAALHNAMPGRFDGWALLPMQDPAAAADELRRAVSTLGLVGGYLPSNVNGEYLHEARFAPIFEAATDLGAPLFVHPSNPPGRERMSNYELAVVAGYLFDTTLNIFHMIFGGLFDRYPALKLCCTHLGGYAPMLRSRMQRELETNPSLAAGLKRPLNAYLQSIYFDTICFEPAYIRSLIDAGSVDASHLLLGSDTPFPLGEPDPVGFINRSFATDAAGTADGILHRNVEGFFGVCNG